MTDANTRDAIQRCWNNGSGLKETQMSLLRSDRINIDRETIRRHFVQFSDQITGQGAA